MNSVFSFFFRSLVIYCSACPLLDRYFFHHIHHHSCIHHHHPITTITFATPPSPRYRDHNPSTTITAFRVGVARVPSTYGRRATAGRWATTATVTATRPPSPRSPSAAPRRPATSPGTASSAHPPWPPPTPPGHTRTRRLWVGIAKSLWSSCS